MNGSVRERPHGTPSAGLWFGWFGAPLAFLFQLAVVYAATSHACRGRGRGLLHGITAVCLLVAVAGTVVAWRDVFATERVTRPPGSIASFSRMRFMSQVGAMTGTLFTLVLIAEWIVVSALDPCPW